MTLHDCTKVQSNNRNYLLSDVVIFFYFNVSEIAFKSHLSISNFVAIKQKIYLLYLF